MIEIYKDILCYNGDYKVSNLGNVKSLKLGKERLLKKGLNSQGYEVVVFSNGNKRMTKNVHSLVAEYFLDYVPNGYNYVINHIDFDKKNNCVCNLEIITNRENTNKKHIQSTSKYVGVSWFKKYNKWVSKIYINGKQEHLGYFGNEYDAYCAYINRKKMINYG